MIKSFIHLCNLNFFLITTKLLKLLQREKMYILNLKIQFCKHVNFERLYKKKIATM